MSQNVKIPLPLLSQTISLLESLDMRDYDDALRCDYYNVYHAFLKKRHNLELRDAYAKIIFAPDEDARFEARMRYLQQKRVRDDF